MLEPSPLVRVVKDSSPRHMEIEKSQESFFPAALARLIGNPHCITKI